MGQDKVLDLFFEEPNRLFKMREIARLAKIPKTTAARRLNKLLRDRLIIRKKETVLGYVANENSRHFRFRKKIDFLEKINSLGLVNYLEEAFRPKCIVLFGSFAKGEYHKGSDIDIFVQAKGKSCDLAKFEKKLKHPISLFFEDNIHKLSDELFNNVINGIKLSGYIKAK